MILSWKAFFGYFKVMGVLSFLTVVFVLCGNLWAMPAIGKFFAVQQPDGTSLNVRTVGNEFYHFKVTEDGFAVTRDSAGHFYYVGEDGATTGIRAHQEGNRSAKEREFLKSLDKKAVVKLLNGRRHSRQNQALKKSTQATLDGESETPAIRPMPKLSSKVNGGEKKALVVLVQFGDVKFSMEDPKAEFEKYLSQEGYNENGNQGSVKDYFVDNSMGNFAPSFDVVGPITLDYLAYKSFGNYSAYGVMGAAIALTLALDTLVARGDIDFKQYDNDGDSYLDFVHMIYAGLGSNDSGQDSAMWPHKWNLSDAYSCLMDRRCSNASRPSSLTARGRAVASSGSGFNKKYYYVDAYASSNELDGLAWENSYHRTKQKVGVGTFIHEFSHLMGLGDHYATDDSDVATPRYWDVMDGGAYNYTSTKSAVASVPPYYSGFERMYLGWMEADEIIAGDKLELAAISSNKAVTVTNPKNKNEFYVLEYRDGRKWDSGLPNHGMLIWHIDYDSLAWYKAEINTAEKVRVDVVEADGDSDEKTITSDVFPGSSWQSGKRYTTFSNFSTCSGSNLGYSLKNITELSDYSGVTFNVTRDSSVVEPEESSSSETPVGSSSSEMILVEESSSSEVDIEVSDNSDVSGFAVATHGLSVSRDHNVLNFAGLPEGNKALRIFSLNGNLLLSRQVGGGSLSVDMGGYFGRMAVIVQLVVNNRVVATIPFR